jgi:C4-dicarboxylate transporter, DctQ subunit
LLDRLDRGLARTSMALVVAGCAIVVGLFFLIIVDVTIRTAGINPPGFTVAVVEYGLLYFAVFAAPFLVRVRGHVVIEAVVAQLPRAAQTALARIVYFVCFLLCLLFVWFSAQLVWEAVETERVDLRGIDIPLWLQYLPMPFGFLVMGLEFLPFLLGLRSYYSYDLGEVKDGM